MKFPQPTRYFWLAILSLSSLTWSLFWIWTIYSYTLGWKGHKILEELPEIQKIKRKLNSFESYQPWQGGHPAHLNLGQFIVNLQNENNHMLKTEIILELADPESLARITEPTTLIKVKDLVLQKLSEFSLEKIETLEGKLLLKESIRNSIIEKWPDIYVKNILFYDFVFQ